MVFVQIQIKPANKRIMSIGVYTDEHFMKLALAEAQKALEKDEVPVGAIVVCKNQVIARAHNLTETLTDVTAHAEMQAITSASEYLGGKYLKDCVMYITLEPCVMCAGALKWSQIGKIIYGAADKKQGSNAIQQQLLAPGIFHPKTTLVGGLCEEECSSILTQFFEKKRKQG
ncbi:MAG: tRNA(adenine34) deaminase [Flavobacteriales bacterium]|jgi:tRNA(adenine34) deaminase